MLGVRTKLTTLLLLAVAGSDFAQGTGTNAAPRKPNIVVILADDLGWKDTARYGSTYYETPNIDRPASQGMRFTEGYAANPLCLRVAWKLRSRANRPSSASRLPGGR